MEVAPEGTNDAGHAAHIDEVEHIDFSFVPDSLIVQCQRLIESYHELHGYTCLPDILWKARLGPFIEAHLEFRQLLKKASTTRSAKKSNEGFIRIATTIFSLEILVSSFAGWSAIYPQAASRAHAILKRHARSPVMPLMEFYLYPPKYTISSAAIATLAPPASRQADGAHAYRNPNPELVGDRIALDHLNAIQAPPDRKTSRPATASPG